MTRGRCLCGDGLVCGKVLHQRICRRGFSFKTSEGKGKGGTGPKTGPLGGFFHGLKEKRDTVRVGKRKGASLGKVHGGGYPQT